jgi:hypothetical protein
MKSLAAEIQNAEVESKQVILETRPPIGISAQEEEGMSSTMRQELGFQIGKKCSSQSTKHSKEKPTTLPVSVSLEDPPRVNSQRQCKMIHKMLYGRVYEHVHVRSGGMNCAFGRWVPNECYSQRLDGCGGTIMDRLLLDEMLLVNCFV